MNPHLTNWTPGIIVLAAALGAAILFVLNSKKGAAKEAKAPEDLDERYNALLAQLKEHAANKHLAPEAEWQAEQTRLELAAAAVLREKAGASHEATKAAARAEKLAKAQAASTGGSTLRGALIGGGVVAFFAVLGFVLTQQSTARVDGAGMTGTNPAEVAGTQGAPMQNRPDPQKEIDRLRKQAEESPDDIEVLAKTAGELIKLQAFNEAFPIVTRASGIDPYHVQTRIWRAVLDAVDGQAMSAVADLEHLGDSYEGAYKARLYAGLISLELEQPERALKQLELYLAEAPQSEQPPFIAMSVQRLKQQLQAGKPGP